jgi:hypothetical protein
MGNGGEREKGGKGGEKGGKRNTGAGPHGQENVEGRLKI